MTVHEFARREQIEQATTRIGDPAMLEELAQMLVEQAIALRTLATLWRLDRVHAKAKEAEAN